MNVLLVNAEQNISTDMTELEFQASGYSLLELFVRLRTQDKIEMIRFETAPNYKVLAAALDAFGVSGVDWDGKPATSIVNELAALAA